MKVRLNRTRWTSLAVAGALLFSACGFGENKPTEAKITSPAANSVLKVGEQIQIEGMVTGQGITKVDIVIDNTTYASLSAEDKATGVDTFPIEAGKIPWTPPAAGPHALQLIVYGAPDDKLLSKSEPVLVQAQAAEVQAPAEPTQPAPPTPPAPAATGPTAAPATGGNNPPAPAPGNNAAGGAPSMSVINDFVNVRKGPGVGYDKLGQLDKGQTAPVKGKSSDGEWLQISYPAAANGVGWVKLKDGADTLVQPNTAAGSVPVVAAPALPTQAPVVVQPAQPAQPAQPPVIIPIGPTAPPPSVATPIPSAATSGSRNVLRVNVNPIGSGGTAYATWSIPSFKEGEFDKGDGRGYVGPIAGAMTVDVPGVTGARTLRLRWRDTAGQQLEDTLILQVAGQAVVVPTTQVTSECNASNPDWRGGGTSAYTFCVKKDLGWTDGGQPVRSFTVGQDVSLTADWSIYGINGIRFVVEPSNFQCSPQGTSVINEPTSGQGSYTFNVKQLAYGGYIVHLKVTRKDGQEVNYTRNSCALAQAVPAQPARLGLRRQQLACRQPSPKAPPHNPPP
ncbi:MAG: SH3 domain-containing protein [Anaerolineae bacterium]|nr:SH3 domain-containing protein [Anaerolineae bacterium]